MKKRLIICIILAVCLWASTSLAQLQLVAPSAEQNGDVAITAGQGYFHGIMIGCASGVTINAYDSTGASGRKLMPTLYFPGSATSQTHSVDMGSYGVFYHTGVYIDVTTTGTLRYIVYFTSK